MNKNMKRRWSTRALAVAAVGAALMFSVGCAEEPPPPPAPSWITPGTCFEMHYPNQEPPSSSYGVYNGPDNTKDNFQMMTPDCDGSPVEFFGTIARADDQAGATAICSNLLGSGASAWKMADLPGAVITPPMPSDAWACLAPPPTP